MIDNENIKIDHENTKTDESHAFPYTKPFKIN